MSAILDVYKSISSVSRTFLKKSTFSLSAQENIIINRSRIIYELKSVGRRREAAGNFAKIANDGRPEREIAFRSIDRVTVRASLRPSLAGATSA